jgi:hypothetical protein
MKGEHTHYVTFVLMRGCISSNTLMYRMRYVSVLRVHGASMMILEETRAARGRAAVADDEQRCFRSHSPSMQSALESVWNCGCVVQGLRRG